MQVRMFVAALTLFCALSIAVHAQDRPGDYGYKHEENHDTIYRGWNQPGTTISCCGGGDCRETKWRIGVKGGEGFYEALIDRVWCPVPAEKVIHGRAPPGMGHICAPRAAEKDGCPPVYCFHPGPQS